MTAVVDLTTPAPDGTPAVAVPAQRSRHRTASAPARPRRFRPDIQGLRAIAVLLVVLYHAGVPGITGGYVGVDVFFVISGYLITGQLFGEAQRTGRLSLTGFYARRIRRLLPPAAVVVLSTVVVGRFVLPASQALSLTKDAIYTAFYGLNYHLAAAGVQYQNATAPPSALQHFWSLAVEEQFYLVWPLLIALGLLVARWFRRAALAIAITAIIGASLLLSATISSTNAPLAYFSLQTRAWELGLGALTTLSVPLITRLPAWGARLTGWVGLAMILTSAFVFDDRTVYPGTAAMLPVVGAALVLGSGLFRVSHSVETVLLDRPVMQYLGRSSYAWYLWHWPMLILLPAWAGHPLSHVQRVEVVILALWFAILTYFLENASHRSSWTARRWIPAGIGLSATVIACSLLVHSAVPSLDGTGVARTATTLTGADTSAVQAEIDASLSIEDLPRNLTPTLLDAPKDFPPSKPNWNNTDVCLADLKTTSSPLCTFGSHSATKTAVLLGDSHAEQWLTPVVQNAEAAGWKVVEVTKAACPVADLTVWNNTLNRSYTECDTFRRSLPAVMKQLNPQLIIASQSDMVPWDSVGDAKWATLEADGLTALAGPGTKIAYIGDTPTPKNDVVPCLEQNPHQAQKCSFLRKDAFQQFTGRSAAVEKAMKDRGIGYLPTMDFFCNATICPPVVGNMTLYRDDGHVTNTYAKYLAPMLKPLFEGTSS